MKRPLNLFVCLLVPGLILASGGIYAAAYRFREMPKLMDNIEQGMVPPGFSLELPKSGKYTVWLQTATVFQGVEIDHEDHLQEGGRIHIFNKADGKEISLRTLIKSKRSFGAESAVGLGHFETLRNNLTVEVKGAGITEPAVIGISPNRLGGSIGVLLHLLGIISATLLLSFIALAILLHRRKKQLDSEPDS